MKRIFVVALCVLVSAMTVGCVKPPPPVDDGANSQNADQGNVEHVVKYSGETLSVIAAWYTGKSENWKAIAQMNPGLKPERIRIGQSVLIPRSMIVEERPLTQDFVKRFRVGPSTQRRDSTKDAADSDTTAGKGGDTAAPSDVAPEKKTAAPEPKAVEPAPSAADDDFLDVKKPDPIPAPEKPTVPSAGTGDSKSVAPVPTGKSKEDIEREKLLDELLNQ